jgi:HK97 family phage major capsid protein
MSNELESLHRAFEAMKEHNEKLLTETRKNGEASALTKEAMDKIHAEIDEVKARMKELRAAPAHTGMASSQRTPEQEKRAAVFSKYLRQGSQDMASEERGLLGQSDETGGFLVPDDFSNQVLMNAYNMAELRPLCNVGTTGRDAVVVPSLKKPTVSWGTAGIAVSDQTLTTGRERIPVNFLQGLVLLDNDTLNDAEANVLGQLSSAFSEAIAEAEDTAHAAGTGAGQPQGVVVNSTVQASYVASGIAAALSNSTNNGVDVLIQAFYGLKKTYRRNATWAFNSATERIIRQLKDANGQYLWQPPVQAGAPATLLGRPVVNPEGMPDIAANTYPIVVGDFQRYWIRDRAGVTVQRLVERYAEYNQTGFIVRRRTAGQVVLPEAFKPIKIAVS